MPRRTPKTTLAIATILLALLDWMAGSTIAEPDGPPGSAPPDEMVPAGASLEDGTAGTARIGPIAIRIVPAGHRYVLEATNPTGTARDVEVWVRVLDTTVNPFARMAPMPQEVVSEKVALHCPPGERVRRPLVLAGLPPTAARGTNGGPGNIPGLQSFRTREFVVADAALAVPTGRAVQAQRATRSSSLGAFGRPAGETVLRVALGPIAPTANAAVQ
jgi:hypothetical protein